MGYASTIANSLLFFMLGLIIHAVVTIRRCVTNQRTLMMARSCAPAAIRLVSVMIRRTPRARDGSIVVTSLKRRNAEVLRSTVVSSVANQAL